MPETSRKMYLTKQGLQLFSKIQTGATKLGITRVVVGSGTLNDDEKISELQTLKNSVNADVRITDHKVIGDGQAMIAISIGAADNSYYLREIGIFADDPDVGEILYSYGNFGRYSDYIEKFDKKYPTAQEGIICIAVGNASELNINIADKLYITPKEFKNHTESEVIDHPDGSVTKAKLNNDVLNYIADEVEVGVAAEATSRQSADENLQQGINNINSRLWDDNLCIEWKYQGTGTYGVDLPFNAAVPFRIFLPASGNTSARDIFVLSGSNITVNAASYHDAVYLKVHNGSAEVLTPNEELPEYVYLNPIDIQIKLGSISFELSPADMGTLWKSTSVLSRNAVKVSELTSDYGSTRNKYITEQISDIAYMAKQVSQSAMLKDGNCTVNFIIPTYFKTYADYDNNCNVVKSDTPVHMAIGDYQADFDINFESGFTQDDTSQQGQTEVRHFYLSKSGIGWSAEAVTPYVNLNTFDFKVALVDVEFTYDTDYGWLPPGEKSTGGEEIAGESSISPLCSLSREKVINAMILNLLTNSQNHSSAGDSTMSSRISSIESKLDKITAPTGSSVVYVENT